MPEPVDGGASTAVAEGLSSFSAAHHVLAMALYNASCHVGMRRMMLKLRLGDLDPATPAPAGAPATPSSPREVGRDAWPWS